MTKLAVISINDVYRINGIDNGDTGGLARVRELRKKIEEKYQHVLFLHAGDFLHPSFISKQDDGRAMITSLNMMDGALGEFDDNMVVTWGNHEFDKGRMEHVPLMNELLSQAEFNWLDSNITWKKDALEAENNLKQLLFPVGDKTVGLFSFTTDIVHPDYIESFTDYETTAKAYVPQLRAAGADFVIALTHHWLQDDRALMNLPAKYRPDIIFGGHEHYAQIEQVNNNWILKADADAASAVVAEITLDSSTTSVTPQIISLDHSFPKDTATAQLTQVLEDENDVAYCRQLNQTDDCLERKLGHTKVKLMAEETEIRRFETNLGNALADLSLQAFAQCDADIALLNSGSIRLNQNLPAHSDITVKHLEEMFPYSSDLRLIEFDRQLLPQIINHSISSWTANGHWLQIAGMAYIHDPETTTASHIHLKNERCGDEPTKTTIRAVVPYYLISDHTDHDGYSMINESMQVSCDANGAEVKRLLTEYLNQQATGLAVTRDFRICNTSRDQCD
ncbi:metallophosphoesterase [Marinicella sp. S1101]|uniref:bifunctional metallophosphatase/5'-nucleotidase n=1 Tax=Marinicella marina TaxID=2996016 RepID=UPI0024BC326A|nr:metallophosphoesterase [Marinicella marina]MCX7553990.1 metallophosphoesterase [Marinicella marina]MDJ1140482.1 metallophosphoesterase [Marinicella marina]